MVQKNYIENLIELLRQCAAQPYPLPGMRERLCSRLMEAEGSWQLEAEKMEKGLNERVNALYNRSLAQNDYPVFGMDTLEEKHCVNIGSVSADTCGLWCG